MARRASGLPCSRTKEAGGLLVHTGLGEGESLWETAGAERPHREHGLGGARMEGRWEIERTCQPLT